MNPREDQERAIQRLQILGAEDALVLLTGNADDGVDGIVGAGESDHPTELHLNLLAIHIRILSNQLGEKPRNVANAGLDVLGNIENTDALELSSDSPLDDD